MPYAAGRRVLVGMRVGNRSSFLRKLQKNGAV
jgi:hypothetical protein